MGFARLIDWLCDRGRKLAIFAAAMLSTFAFTTSLTEASIKFSFSGSEVKGLILLVAFTLFYHRILFLKGKRRSEGNILSLLFSFFMVFGAAFRSTGNWSCAIGNWMRGLTSLVMFLGYAVFFKAAIVWLFGFWERLSEKESRPAARHRLLDLLERHPMKTAFVVLMLCWSIYVVIEFPGVLTADVYDQLRQYMGLPSWSANAATLIPGGSELNTHHPIPHTLLIGFLYTLFWRIGLPDLGIFLMGLSKLLIQACLFSYTIGYMKKLGVSQWIRLYSVAFYAFMPYFPMFGFAISKDAVFSIFGLAFFLFLTELVRAPESVLKRTRNLLLGGAIALGVLLLRKNGIFVVLPVLPFLAVFIHRRKPCAHATRKVVLLLLCPVLLSLAIENVVYPLCGIGKGSPREMLSVPFQQTARYFKEHEDEVTEEERAAVDRVLDADAIAELYRPVKADPVKNSYRKGATGEDLAAYFKVWFAQLLKHPDTYVQATMNNAYGYFYPDHQGMYMYIGDMKMTGSGAERFVEGYVEVSAPEILKPFVFLLKGAILLYKILPVSGMTMGVGVQSWVWMLSLAYLAKKKQLGYGIPMVIQAGILLTCVASPINGSARYVLLMNFCLPLMLAITTIIPRRDAAHGTEGEALPDSTRISAGTEKEVTDEAIHGIDDQ